jgi:hypothetical protein
MTLYCRHYQRNRVIQYSRAGNDQSTGYGVLDAPHKLIMTTW